jgi:hypothetical protein
VCASWEQIQHVFGPKTTREPHGASTGGDQEDAICPTGAIKGWSTQGTVGEDQQIKFVQEISVQCKTLVQPEQTVTVNFTNHVTEYGITTPKHRFIAHDSSCPPGEFAIGFYGRAGMFLDSIGLICGRPAPVGTAPPSQAKNMPSALPTAPTITLPQGFIVKGKGVFKITPSQYLTKTHAQVRLRWLNPPANLQNKGVDFYNYEVPMNLIAGPNGIDAPEIYLAPGAACSCQSAESQRVEPAHAV